MILASKRNISIAIMAALILLIATSGMGITAYAEGEFLITDGDYMIDANENIRYLKAILAKLLF